MTTLTITLPNERFRALEEASARLNLVPEEVVCLIIETYLSRPQDVSKEISEDMQEKDSGLSLFLNMSQSLLAKDWDTPEEDEIWAHL